MFRAQWVLFVLLAAPASAAAQPCTARPNALVADLGQHVLSAGYQRTLGCYAVAQALLAREYLEGDDFRALLGEATAATPGADDAAPSAA